MKPQNSWSFRLMFWLLEEGRKRRIGPTKVCRLCGTCALLVVLLGALTQQWFLIAIYMPLAALYLILAKLTPSSRDEAFFNHEPFTEWRHSQSRHTQDEDGI